MRWFPWNRRRLKPGRPGGPGEGGRPQVMIRARVVVHGRVQGVYYRTHARDKAARLGVTGWIRNRPDGSVEAVLEGDEPSVKAMLEWCARGSPRAAVSATAVSWEPHTAGFERFSVLDDGF